MTIVLRILALLLVLVLGTLALSSQAEAQSAKPNLAIIWGDARPLIDGSDKCNAAHVRQRD